MCSEPVQLSNTGGQRWPSRNRICVCMAVDNWGNNALLAREREHYVSRSPRRVWKTSWMGERQWLPSTSWESLRNCCTARSYASFDLRISVDMSTVRVAKIGNLRHHHYHPVRETAPLVIQANALSLPAGHWIILNGIVHVLRGIALRCCWFLHKIGQSRHFLENSRGHSTTMVFSCYALERQHRMWALDLVTDRVWRHDSNCRRIRSFGKGKLSHRHDGGQLPLNRCLDCRERTREMRAKFSNGTWSMMSMQVDSSL